MPTTDQQQSSILITGLQGLVASVFAKKFSDRYQISSMDISDPHNPVDITNRAQVFSVIKNSPASSIIHAAAFTDVTKAWEDRNNRQGLTYTINVAGTKNIVDAATEYKKYLVHISTAFVFDGEKPGLYTETDPIHPIEWYGQTKAEAEKLVLDSPTQAVVLRIDFPFRQDNFIKPDIVRKTLQALKAGRPLFSDHYFGPTMIEDFAKVLDWCLRTKPAGLYHASSGEQWSDFEFGKTLVESHNLGYSVKPGSLADYLKTLNRPYQKNTAMDCHKLISAIDFELTPIATALKAVKL